MNRSWIVTPEDLSKGDLIDPAWYPVEIKDVEFGEAGKDAKNPGSTTVTFHFTVIDGKKKGQALKRLFSEVAWGFAKNFFATMKYPQDAQGNYQISEDLFRQSIGAKLAVYVKRGKNKDTGNEFNEVADFRPL